MTAFDALILGIVQGVTEFLPISSSGHLVLTESILGLSLPGLSFQIAVHAGTLLAVLWVYRRDILELITAAMRWKRGGEGVRLIRMLILGSIPAAIIGLTAESLVERLFDSLTAVGIFLLLTGFIVLLGDRLGRREGGRGLARLTTWGALWIGLFQAFAIAPGVSRSGSSIAAGLMLGLRREEAARFSFLLSIPAILGALLLDLPGFLRGESPIPPPYLLLGLLSAAFFGLLAIRFLLRVLNRFGAFAYYCWLLGAIIILWVA